MCNPAFVLNEECTNQQQLANALGCAVDELPPHTLYINEDGPRTGSRPDMCLCPINLRAAAATAGLVALPPDYDIAGTFMEWVLQPSIQEENR